MLDASLQQINNYLTALHGKVDALAKRPSGGGGTATPQPFPFMTSYRYDRYLADGFRFRMNGQTIMKPVTITALTENSVSVKMTAHGLVDNDAAGVVMGQRWPYYGLVTNLNADNFIVSNTNVAVPAHFALGAAHASGLVSFTAAAKPFQVFTVKVPEDFTIQSYDLWFAANTRATTYVDLTMDQGKPFLPEDMYVPLALGRQAIDGMTSFSMGTTRTVNGNLYTLRYNPLAPVGLPIYINVRY